MPFEEFQWNFREECDYDTVESHRKPGFHPLSRKQNFGNSRRGGQIDPPLSPHSIFRINILRPATLLKKDTMTHVFSCGFYKTFKNTIFIEHHRWLFLLPFKYKD